MFLTQYIPSFRRNFSVNTFKSEKNFWVRKGFGSIHNFLVEIILGPLEFLVQNFLALNKCLVQNRIKKFGPKTFWSTKIMTPKKLGQKCLVKIRPITVEILMIWANVARAYVALTNVTIWTWSKNLLLKFDQNRVNNSSDIDWWYFFCVVGGVGWFAKLFSCQT